MPNHLGGLTEQEIKQFWKGVDNANILPQAKQALLLILVTWQRPGEVAGMRWDEIEGRWWTIPSERTKNKLAHRVWLSDPAVEILEAAQNDTAWVFPAPLSGSHLRADSLPKALGKVGIDNLTPHDLRRSAATTTPGIRRTVQRKILNHKDSDVTAVYDRHSYDQEKMEALDKWAAKLTQIIAGKKADVVAIRRAGEGP